MKNLIVAIVLLISAVPALAKAKRQAHPRAHAAAALPIFQCESGREFPGGSLQEVGYRLVNINGQLVKNTSFAIVPAADNSIVYAKIWSPGHNPADPLDDSDTVICVNPFPRPPAASSYYPDTYRN